MQFNRNAHMHLFLKKMHTWSQFKREKCQEMEQKLHSFFLVRHKHFQMQITHSELRQK